MFFKCMKEGCGLSFPEKKDRNDHYKEHERSKRPFECNKCKQCFTQISSLQKHARVHDKRKPYLCKYDECGMAFTQASNLIRHERIHTGIKPYKCDKCEKSFASSSNLKQHKEIHQVENDRSRFMCPLEVCKKVYLYFSSLKKHMSKNHKDYYDVNFNQPTKLEIQSFKKMTTQNHAEEEFDRDSQEYKEKNITEVNKRGENRRKAKNDALKKLHQMQLSSSLEDDPDDIDIADLPPKPNFEVSKRTKIEENKEVEIKQNNKHNDVRNNEELSHSSFASFQKKKNEKLLTSKFDSQSTIRNLQYENPQCDSTKTNKMVNMPSSTELKLNDYYDYCSKLFSSKTQEQQSNNDLLASQLNFDSVLILKSLVLQDLFSSAFRRYLECSKQNLAQNLANRLNEPIQNNNSLLQTDVLGRHSYPKRKNTDVMSSETIETDLQNCLGNHNKGRSPIIINKTMPLSSFYPHTKARCNSLLSNITKTHSLEDVHREEQNK